MNESVYKVGTYIELLGQLKTFSMCCRGAGCVRIIWSLAVLHCLPFPALDLTQILWRSVKRQLGKVDTDFK